MDRFENQQDMTSRVGEDRKYRKLQKEKKIL